MLIGSNRRSPKGTSIHQAIGNVRTMASSSLAFRCLAGSAVISRWTFMWMVHCRVMPSMYLDVPQSSNKYLIECVACQFSGNHHSRCDLPKRHQTPQFRTTVFCLLSTGTSIHAMCTSMRIIYDLAWPSGNNPSIRGMIVLLDMLIRCFPALLIFTTTRLCIGTGFRETLGVWSPKLPR